MCFCILGCDNNKTHLVPPDIQRLYLTWTYFIPDERLLWTCFLHWGDMILNADLVKTIINPSLRWNRIWYSTTFLNRLKCCSCGSSYVHFLFCLFVFSRYVYILFQRSPSTRRIWTTYCVSSTRWSKTSRRQLRSDTSSMTNTWRRWRGGAATASVTAASATQRVRERNFLTFVFILFIFSLPCRKRHALIVIVEY